jgi:hypothetical protein
VTWDRHGHDTGDDRDWSAAEHALLDAALGYYGAAEAIIDLSGAASPRLHIDAAGMQAVRDAMVVLEQRIRVAHAADVDAERIASITRLEHEVVAAILARSPQADVRGAPEVERVGHDTVTNTLPERDVTNG